ncbi:MAG TPA: MaoC family dehydratase [Dehalococcoidia bacterium]|nr:MaoC family dehydratase [Dehalococcoidia bacterium]
MNELSYDSIDTDREYGPWKYPLADRFERYMAAVENAQPWHNGRSPWGPAVAPPSILGLAAMRFLDEVGPVPPGTLHAKQEIEAAAALRLDRKPAAYGRFAARFEKRGRNYFTFETRWRDETGLILGKSRVTMAFPANPAPPREQGTRNKEHEGDRKGEFQAIARTVTQEKMTAFSEDSANAARGKSVHVHSDVAEAAGFPATVANGLMAADYMSELMEGALGKDWYAFAGLSATFLRPIFAGDTVTANGRLKERFLEGAVERLVYDLWAQNQRGELVAAATATALAIPGQK